MICCNEFAIRTKYYSVKGSRGAIMSLVTAALSVLKAFIALCKIDIVISLNRLRLILRFYYLALGELLRASGKELSGET